MSHNTPAARLREATVFVVDDDDGLCDGLCDLLESVGLNSTRFGSAEEFIAYWRDDMPGCLMLDARLPGMTGVEFQEKLARSGVRIPIIFMTGHGDIPMVRKVMKAGAIEFLTKPFDKEEMLAAIRQAFALDAGRRGEQRELSAIQARLATLTPREIEVMDHVTAGALNKQIAGALNLSEITVKLHRRRVFEKMRAGSLAELVKMTEKVRPSALR
jgi:FixJ family two-component response regulator